MDKIEDNGKGKNQKDNSNSESNDINFIAEEQERFYLEENISPEVKGALDDIVSDILEILSNRFFRILNAINEKMRMPRKKKGRYSSSSISYLMLKNINPAIGNKKKSPKIKFSL